MLTPEQIERMRAIGLTLDRAGTFWHDGSAVTHPRLRQALLRWLDVLDDGRDVVRLDDKRYAYVDVADAHLRARSARWESAPGAADEGGRGGGGGDRVGAGSPINDRCLVLWDDDVEEELAYATLRIAADQAFYAGARGGRLRGRIAGPAHHAVAERIVEEPDGSFALAAAGRRWPISALAAP
jgi:hypothetical protein